MNYLPKEILALFPEVGQERQHRPLIMGILNVTPDSFSDGGVYRALPNALAQARKMIDEGADIIDIGGESSRPQAQAVSLQEELDRVLPVIEALKKETVVRLSIDTYKPEVMKAALDAGVDMVNDIRALQIPGALDLMAQYSAPICLMHMQGDPQTMQKNPKYSDIMSELIGFFERRMEACIFAGIAKHRLILDPGFGFGKTTQHNAVLTKKLSQLENLGLPILFGASRKTSIGAILNKPESERLYGSIAAAVLAVANGAVIVRVHDVAETQDALKVAYTILSAE